MAGVLSDVLADRRALARLVEQVVADLISRAEAFAVAGERGDITLDAAARIIGVAKMTALRMIRIGDLKGRQACKGAPWVIRAEDVAAFGVRERSTGPVTPNPAQQTLDFQ